MQEIDLGKIKMFCYYKINHLEVKSSLVTTIMVKWSPVVTWLEIIEINGKK